MSPEPRSKEPRWGIVMEDLSRYSLEELMDRVSREGLIDRCRRDDVGVTITQGDMEVVLDDSRASAFLRGVIRGMGTDRPALRALFQLGAADREMWLDEVPPDSLLSAFRDYLMNRWQHYYDQAGEPLGPSRNAMLIWMRYATRSTAS